MADYDCFPLWDEDGRNVDPWSLAIPADLANALAAWSSAYTATLNSNDPLASGFADEAARSGWLHRGEDLAHRLRDHGMTVEYVHDRA